MSNVEKWLQKELELNRKHEEILMRREAMLRGTETYYDSQEQRSSSFIADFSKAKSRNEEFLQGLDDLSQCLKEDLMTARSPKFNTVRNNYWTMVRNMFPEWHNEYQEYVQRHGPSLPDVPAGRQSGRRSASLRGRQSGATGGLQARQDPQGVARADDTDMEAPSIDLDLSLGPVSTVTMTTASQEVPTGTLRGSSLRSTGSLSGRQKRVRYSDTVNEVPIRARKKRSRSAPPATV